MALHEKKNKTTLSTPALGLFAEWLIRLVFYHLCCWSQQMWRVLKVKIKVQKSMIHHSQKYFQTAVGLHHPEDNCKMSARNAYFLHVFHGKASNCTLKIELDGFYFIKCTWLCGAAPKYGLFPAILCICKWDPNYKIKKCSFEMVQKCSRVVIFH